MLVTITEMGPGKYMTHFRAHNQLRHCILTPGLKLALELRGRVVWETPRFGHGKLGEQRQYEVRGKWSRGAVGAAAVR